MEKAKHIPGFPEYIATVDGRIYSTASNWRGYGKREMAQQPNDDGYPSVRLRVAVGVRKRMAVHKLVAFAFLESRPSDQHEIRHLDGDKNNNHVSNLAWGTRKENAADREAHGKTSRGLSHSNAIKRGIYDARA